VQGRRNMRAQLLPGQGPLARVRPLAVFVVVIGLFTAGVLVSGVVGALLLGVLAVGVGVLLATTWRLLAPTERVVRLVALAILVAVAILQLR
jgi:chromate transport protein ChrA